MKPIVVYNSKTGFTKKYGEWIAQELGCKAVSVKQAGYSDCDVIIYGGRLMAGKIAGLNKIKNNPALGAKKLVIFASGMTGMMDSKAIDKIKEDNLSASEQKNIPFYYFEGGVNYEAMGFLSRSMLKMMVKSLAKKENRTVDETNMMNALASSSDHSDKAYIRPLIDYVKGL